MPKAAWHFTGIQQTSIGTTMSYPSWLDKTVPRGWCQMPTTSLVRSSFWNSLTPVSFAGWRKEAKHADYTSTKESLVSIRSPSLARDSGTVLLHTDGSRKPALEDITSSINSCCIRVCILSEDHKECEISAGPNLGNLREGEKQLEMTAVRMGGKSKW